MNTFDESSHTYMMAGRSVPSVTQIISEVLPHHQWATEWHMHRGQQIHKAAELIAQGKLPVVDEAIEGHVEGLRRFFSKEVSTVITTERQVYSKRMRYAGTLDLIAYLGTVGLAVVDYKSSGCEVRTALQMCAYVEALREEIPASDVPKYGVAVFLPGDGTYKCRTVKLAEYVNKWRAVLSVYRIMQMAE